MKSQTCPALVSSPSHFLCEMSANIKVCLEIKYFNVILSDPSSLFTARTRTVKRVQHLYWPVQLLRPKSQYNLSQNSARISTLKKTLVTSSFWPANPLCHEASVPPFLLSWIGTKDWFIVASLLVKRDQLNAGSLGIKWTFCINQHFCRNSSSVSA